MGLDQAILGARDLEETLEELTDLHKNWVLGVEEEDSWGRGIEAGVGNLWGVHSVRDEGGSVVYRLVGLSTSEIFKLTIQDAPPEPERVRGGAGKAEQGGRPQPVGKSRLGTALLDQR